MTINGEATLKQFVNVWLPAKASIPTASGAPLCELNHDQDLAYEITNDKQWRRILERRSQIPTDPAHAHSNADIGTENPFSCIGAVSVKVALLC